MRYFKLIYDYDKDEDYINCNFANIHNMDEYIVSDGKLINNWDIITFEFNPIEGEVFTDYVANLYRWLIVSKKFKKVTKELIQSQVQYLPVNLINRITAENQLCYVANIINVIDALDIEKSKYSIFELDDEKIISVEKYVLKEKQLKDNHIFRLKNDTIPVFVSEILKNKIEENKLLGFSFLEIETY